MAYNLKSWPLADNKKIVNSLDGYSTDLVDSIHSAFYRALSETRPMSQQFKGSSRLATAFNVWKFIRREIRYKKDPDTFQMIRLPGRLLQDKEGDCKSVSIMAAAILKNLGFPVSFRYVSYRASTTPTHIYVITYEKDYSPIIVDCVYSKFNSEVPYRSKKDILIKVNNS